MRKGSASEAADGERAPASWAKITVAEFWWYGSSDCAVGNTATDIHHAVPANRRNFLIHRNSRNFDRLARLFPGSWPEGCPHDLSEIVYAYASSAADNGSSFAGLSANTPWYNVTTGIAMFFRRFARAIPILAIAGSLAAKKKAKLSAGTMPSDGPLFVGFLLAVIVIFTLLQYLPALALGPIAEHFLAAHGQTF